MSDLEFRELIKLVKEGRERGDEVDNDIVNNLSVYLSAKYLNDLSRMINKKF